MKYQVDLKCEIIIGNEYEADSPEEAIKMATYDYDSGTLMMTTEDINNEIYARAYDTEDYEPLTDWEEV